MDAQWKTLATHWNNIGKHNGNSQEKHIGGNTGKTLEITMKKVGSLRYSSYIKV